MTFDKAKLCELLAGLPLAKWSKTGSTVNIPETEDFAGKQLPITGLDKQYARRLAGYIAAANPANVSALLAENDALRAELQAAANYIDALGGDSKKYRIAMNPPAPPQGDGAC